MTQCKPRTMRLSRLRRRRVEADFEGGRLTSDGGLLLLREVDRRLGLLDAIDDAIPRQRQGTVGKAFKSHDSVATIVLFELSSVATAREEERQILLLDPPHGPAVAHL